MTSRRFSIVAGILAALLAGALAGAADKATGEAIDLRADQKELLSLEPILMTVRLEGSSVPGLPAAVEKDGALQFTVAPAVKARKGGKPLPLEAQGGKAAVRCRTYDLMEWFQFPAEGSFTVRAVVKHNGETLTSAPVAFNLRKPAKGDAEAGPVDRIHHTPWTNYDTNAFCGDTFDVVKRWPKSKLSRYCHYWNGRYSQNKKELEKAIASYQTVIEQHPDFPLADHAAFGIAECLLAQKKTDEAQAKLRALKERLKEKGRGQTVLGHLVDEALRPSAASAKR
jgi:hypothetical protein